MVFVDAPAPVNSGTGLVVLVGGWGMVPLDVGTAVGGMYTVTVALGVTQVVERVEGVGVGVGAT